MISSYSITFLNKYKHPRKISLHCFSYSELWVTQSKQSSNPILWQAADRLPFWSLRETKYHRCINTCTLSLNNIPWHTELILQCFKFLFMSSSMDFSSPSFSLVLRLIAFDLQIKAVTFPVVSTFSARLSADLNSASMFDFILFFCSFKSFSSSRPAALFCLLLCSTLFFSLHLGMFGTSVLQNLHWPGALYLTKLWCPLQHWWDGLWSLSEQSKFVQAF